MNELERDIIREILNIGLARAADSFAVIAQERVMLEVPNLDLVPSASIIERVRDYQTRYVAIQSDIRGDFNGSTFMFFFGPACAASFTRVPTYASNRYAQAQRITRVPAAGD